MAQVLEFRLPDLGEGLTEAEIVRWLVEVGDVVAVDQAVVEVETAKAMVDVPCPYSRRDHRPLRRGGHGTAGRRPLLTVAVGTPDATADPDSSGNVLVGYGTSAAPSRRRRVRPAQGAPGRVAAADPGASAGTGPGAAVEADAFVDVRSDGPVPVISPLVRRLARDNGVDLRRLAGSGPDGLILRVDVEDALRADAARARTAAPAPGVPDEGVVHGTRIPLRGVRGAVADKLARSRREIPDATCWVDADATELLRARTAMNAAGGPKISSSPCSHGSARPRWPGTRTSTRPWTRRPGRSSGSTRCTSGSPRRPRADLSSPSSGTPTHATRSRSPPSSPGSPRPRAPAPSPPRNSPVAPSR